MEKLMQAYEQNIEAVRESLKKMMSIQIDVERLQKTMNQFEKPMNVRYIASGRLIMVCVKVESIKDIEPVLEAISNEFAIEFDNSQDEAALGWRMFTTKNLPWLRVDAELKEDNAACRRVIVGYKQVPEYKIECSDEVVA
jgi:hypothetical protein